MALSPRTQVMQLKRCGIKINNISKQHLIVMVLDWHLYNLIKRLKWYIICFLLDFGRFLLKNIDIFYPYFYAKTRDDLRIISIISQLRCFWRLLARVLLYYRFACSWPKYCQRESLGKSYQNGDYT